MYDFMKFMSKYVKSISRALCPCNPLLKLILCCFLKWMRWNIYCNMTSTLTIPNSLEANFICPRSAYENLSIITRRTKRRTVSHPIFQRFMGDSYKISVVSLSMQYFNQTTQGLPLGKKRFNSFTNIRSFSLVREITISYNQCAEK